MKLSLFFISVITFLLAISPIAYSDNTIIPDRVYDPYRNSAVTSAPPVPNFLDKQETGTHNNTDNINS
ncbi:hypothetical protein, partial [Klebsiella pneumoniae]|uniref:hypothetical protein n=1 Tax=Klebsiella pneumoniae TaxID=573 RepID=UPI003EE17194